MDNSILYTLYKEHPVVTTDSRDCPEGSIFLALKGESFDGNKFAAKALEQGCSYAVVDDPAVVPEGDARYVLVADTLVAFKELARAHRREFTIPVIGITGTNGKTTTKELVSTVLAEKYRVMHTEGNFNNDVGVPKTLLRLNGDHEIAVVEMGASHPGDIKKLVEYVEPTCGLITNVGRAHLQGFGSFEGVKRTKGELYDYLAVHNGLLFLNEGNEDLVAMASEREMERIIGYGQSEETDYHVRGHVLACDPFVRFAWSAEGVNGEYEVETHLVGAYNIDNLLAAIAVGLHFSVSPQQICHALSHYQPSNNRSQLTETEHNTLVVDAYNANPSSMAAAIENFRLMNVGKSKLAILGDMRELGEVSGEEHQKVVNALLSAGITHVWLVGPEFAKTNTTFRKFPDVEAVKEAVAQQQPKDKLILIKGSNGIKLFELPELL